jgi:SAM-dependent methyltransferase
MDRSTTLRRLFAPTGLGLEIGPLHAGIVPKRDGFSVEILDHASTAALREKYRGQPAVDTALIEEVDYVSDGRGLLETIGQPERYDWIVASHVIEHVPDLAGFLLDCQALLRPRGTLVLAVPDKRRCFDALRPPTSTGAVLQAHFDHRTRHPPGTIFDHFADHVYKGGRETWDRAAVGAMTLRHDLALAWDACRMAAQSAAYVDSHGWVFTPSSFRLILRDLNEIGVVAMRELRFMPTDGAEFIVTLSQEAPGCSLDRLSLARNAAEELAEGSGMARGELAELQRRLAEAEQRVADLQASTSWRITAPLRALVRLIRTGGG